MYTHKGKRRFIITVRDINDDKTQGSSKSFSVYESDKMMNKEILIDYLKKVIDKTNEKGFKNEK